MENKTAVKINELAYTHGSQKYVSGKNTAEY